MRLRKRKDEQQFERHGSRIPYPEALEIALREAGIGAAEAHAAGEAWRAIERWNSDGYYKNPDNTGRPGS